MRYRRHRLQQSHARVGGPCESRSRDNRTGRVWKDVQGLSDRDDKHVEESDSDVYHAGWMLGNTRDQRFRHLSSEIDSDRIPVVSRHRRFTGRYLIDECLVIYRNVSYSSIS